MTSYAGKRILLIVTGGVAAYKAGALVRLLVKSGADVRVVLTSAGSRFITAVTLQALSGNPVFTDLWDDRVADNMAHIELSRDRDLILVAPATADFIAKLVHGGADDLASTLCLARDCPLYVAPAMNRQMWDHPATRRNIDLLRADGAVVLGPAAGDQACGEIGMGRMLEPEEIVEDIERSFHPKTLRGKQVIITAGPTFEAIDTVRGITNLSSGKMGFAVAQAAVEAGADVTIVAGHTAIGTPRGVVRVDVISAREMHDAVMSRINRCDVFIAVAAVADYHVVNRVDHKLKKDNEHPTIELALNPDILGTVASLPRAPFCIGFAAESENLAQYAQQKRARKRIPLLAANLAQEAFGRDDNALTLFDDHGQHVLPRAPKLELARQLIAHAVRLMVSHG